MAGLAFTRRGSGSPLVLLHGLGSSRRAWDPVIPLLAEHFDVIAVDLPGFGDSASLPPWVEPHPAALAEAVADLLDGLGIVAPHLAGNSLGGWVALEFARIRRAASLTLLSPAGLWSGGTPRYNRISLRASRWLARHATRFATRLVDYRLGRVLVLGQTHGHPTRLTAHHARAVIVAMANCPGFDATFDATRSRHYTAGEPFDAPVTVAIGSRDLLLRRPSRRLDQLPAGTHSANLPGCGHVPMSDDPVAVASLITASSGLACDSPLTTGTVS